MVLTALTVTIVLYVLISVSFAMIILRIYLSWTNTRRLNIEDAWMFGTLCFLAGIWYSGTGAKYDTNNVSHPELLSPDEVHRREIGSKAALVGRFCYASALWCMKFCILAVYTKIVDKSPQYQRFIKYIWAILFLTWVASMVVTLFECRPFKHYLGCKTAKGQIYIVGICNMVTDLILIIFPMPIVFLIRLPLRRKLEFCTLFSLGFIIIAISGLRVWIVVENGSLQLWRTLARIPSSPATIQQADAESSSEQWNSSPHAVLPTPRSSTASGRPNVSLPGKVVPPSTKHGLD